MDDTHRLTIWGEDPHNEVAWEFSSELLSRWGWLVGPAWTERANFWRKQRNVAILPLPAEVPESDLWGMWQQMQLNALRGGTMVGSTMGAPGDAQQLQHHQVDQMRQYQQLHHQAANLAQQQQQRQQMARPKGRRSRDGIP